MLMFKNKHFGGFDVDNRKAVKAILMIGVAVLGVVIASAVMAPSAFADTDTGDVEIDVDNNGTDYEGNVTLVDSAGNDVETIKTDGDGQAVFSSIEYGDYQLKTSVNNSTVESNIFSHMDDITTAEFDVDSNDLKVDGQTDLVKAQDPTDGSTWANLVNNPTLPSAIGLFLTVFSIIATVAIAWKVVGGSVGRL